MGTRDCLALLFGLFSEGRLLLIPSSVGCFSVDWGLVKLSEVLCFLLSACTLGGWLSFEAAIEVARSVWLLVTGTLLERILLTGW